MKKIITISRQFGSGGSEIGKKLADLLGIEYYDKKILEMASKSSGIAQEMFEKADEKHNSFLYSLSMANYGGMVSPLYLNDVISDDKLYLIQSKTIKEIAEKNSCVIVGRCANEILKDVPGCVNFFIYSTPQDKTQRIMRLYNLSERSAETLIKKTDKKRAAYYNFYSNHAWGAVDSYDLCINSSVLGTDGTVDLLLDFLKYKFDTAK